MSISSTDVIILTTRQREALEWLRHVGKASEKLVRRNGFAVRTMDVLADKGYVQRDYMSRTLGGPFKVYRDLAKCRRES